MSNPVNKTTLARFLYETWYEMTKAELKPGMRLLIGGGFRDPINTIKVVYDHKATLSELQSDHEEAAMRMLLHTKHASETCGRVIIQSPDADVAVTSPLFIAVVQRAVVQDRYRRQDPLYTHPQYLE